MSIRTERLTLLLTWHCENTCIHTATGCANVLPPEDAYLKRVDDHSAVVGCYETRQTWQLRCRGNRWTGTVGVCDSQVQRHHDGDAYPGSARFLFACCFSLPFILTNLRPNSTRRARADFVGGSLSRVSPDKVRWVSACLRQVRLRMVGSSPCSGIWHSVHSSIIRKQTALDRGQTHRVTIFANPMFNRDLDFQSPASYGHRPYTCKILRSKVS